MSSVEPARHALYSVLEDVSGSDNAETLMTHLPQYQANEVASKGDLAFFRTEVDARFDRLEARFDRLDEKIDRMQRFYVGTTVGSMTALTAIFTLAVAFLN